MILPDYPINDDREDKLRRTPLAKKVAELIATFKGKESFVIGIEGVWGSGKTSFINLVLRHLSKDALVVVHFNPWNFTGQNELIADFFASLSGALQNESADEDLVKVLGSYASRLQVSFSPSAKLFGILELSLGDSLRARGRTLQQERESIDAKLRGFTKKIVIVIDDIDRLDSKETKLIMKLVKMTANFPNTVFLLAYDRDRVAKKLDGDASEGNEYLKKIIQISFTLPQPDHQELRQILFGDLDDTIQEVYGEIKLEGEDEKRWGEIVSAGFGDLFKTIRDIKRYISSLRLNWSIVEKEDVNMVDFMAIEAIRVSAPGFYAAMLPHQDIFTRGGPLGTLHFREKADDREARFNELLEEVSPSIRGQIKGICKALFPALDFRMGYSDEFDQIWRNDRRVCADERFRFYYQLGVPRGSISEGEIKSLIAVLKDKDLFAEKILELSNEKRLRPMLGKLVDKLDRLDEGTIKTLVSALWDLEKQIKDERSVIFDFDDIETMTTRIAYHSLKNAVPEERRFEVLEELLNNSKTLYFPARFVAILLDQHKKEEGSRIEPPLIKKEDAEKLKTIVLQRIKNMAADGSLRGEEELPFIFYRWKEWEGEEPVREFIRELISSREGLLVLLRAFVSRVLSTAGNYNNLDKKGIEPLYSLQEIEALVAQITNEDLAQMDAKSREAVELFKNPPKD